MPETQEPQVRSPGQEDPLEEEMATHSSLLAGKSHEQRSLQATIHWVKSQTQLSTHVRTYTATSTHVYLDPHKNLSYMFDWAVISDTPDFKYFIIILFILTLFLLTEKVDSDLKLGLIQFCLSSALAY